MLRIQKNRSRKSGGLRFHRNVEPLKIVHLYEKKQTKGESKIALTKKQAVGISTPSRHRRIQYNMLTWGAGGRAAPVPSLFGGGANEYI